MLAYCFSCGRPNPVKGARLTETRNGRLRVDGRCRECDGRVSAWVGLRPDRGTSVWVDSETYLALSVLASQYEASRGDIVREAVRTLLERLEGRD